MIPDTALIIVDVQNDFCEDGSLAVSGGNAVAERIARRLGRATANGWAMVVATRDWHPVDLPGHFATATDAPDFVDTWPPHCIEHTAGAEFHPALQAALANDRIHEVFSKGTHDAAYSGFEGLNRDDVTLADYLHGHGITHVHICGIATSHCVRATALDAIAGGFQTRVLTDLVVGVTPDAASRALIDLRDAGVELARSQS